MNLMGNVTSKQALKGVLAIRQGIDGKDGKDGEFVFGDSVFSPAIFTSASGEVITTTDSANAKLKNFVLYGKTEQNTTEGKNLFDISVATTSPYGFTNNGDGTLSLKGYLLSDNDGHTLREFAPRLLAGDIATINAITNGVKTIYLQGINITWAYGTSKTITEEMLNSVVCFYGKNEDGYTTTISEIMINLGTTALPFEPYTGGEASPNMNYPQPTKNIGDSGSIVGKVLGKNLWDVEYASDVNNWVSSTAQGGYSEIPVYVGTNNKVSISYKDTLSAGLGIFAGVVISENGSIYSWLYHSTETNLNAKEKTITPVGDYIWIRCLANNINNGSFMQYIGNDLQIEISDVVTDYKPHTEQPFTVLTPNGLKGIGDVRDYVDLESGTRIQNLEKHTITEDGTFIESSDYISFEIPHKPNSKFLFTHGIQDANIINWANNTHMFVMKSFLGVTTIDEFKNLIREKRELGESMEIIYALAEPIITDLTQEELDQYNSLVMNYPNTTIINSDNAYMEVEYVADTKCYIDNKFKEMTSAIAQLL